MSHASACVNQCGVKTRYVNESTNENVDTHLADEAVLNSQENDALTPTFDLCHGILKIIE
jgi:hypothetical protein